MLQSIFLGGGVTLLVLLAEAFTNASGDQHIGLPSRFGWVVAPVIGVVTGLVFALSGIFAGSAWIGLILMVAAAAVIIYRVGSTYGDPPELWAALAALGLMAIAVRAAATWTVDTYGLGTHPFLGGIVLGRAHILFAFAVFGAAIAAYCRGNHDFYGGDPDDNPDYNADRAKFYRTATRVTRIATAAALILALLWGNLPSLPKLPDMSRVTVSMGALPEGGTADGQPNQSGQPDGTTGATATVSGISDASGAQSGTGATNVPTGLTAVNPAEGHIFYNTFLQDGQHQLERYDFGPSPYDPAITAKGYLELLYARMDDGDAALTAGVIAYFDRILKTRMLGVFYESCQHDWAAAINAAKDAWIADNDLYVQTVSIFKTKIRESLSSLTVEYWSSGIEDQMYQDPDTKSGIPDVIVMETSQEWGHMLTFTLRIKGDESFVVRLRIECGFQPTNVAELMQIPAKANPVPKQSTPAVTQRSTSARSGGSGSSSGGGGGTSGGGGSSSGGGSTGGGGSSSGGGGGNTVTTPKNVNAGTTPQQGAGQNDNKTGTGTNTNNGVGSQTSAAEKPAERVPSTSMTPSQYREAIDTLGETNATQGTGAGYPGGGNNPSATPSHTPVDTSTVVDNNGSTGTGYGNKDAETPVSGVSHDAGRGTKIDTSAGDSWGDGNPPA